MPESCSSCSKSVTENQSIVRHGTTSKGTQRYRCKACGRTFLLEYSNLACQHSTNWMIVKLLTEGLGMRSISRVLEISVNTVQQRILSIASRIRKPAISFGKTYEVDELCTFIGQKARKRWIAYALCRENRQVVDFRVGARSNTTLQPVVQTLVLSGAKKIFTDGLRNYQQLIDSEIHSVKRFGTNRIERMNLTLRTHIKRLNRRTICFSKSWSMLNACLKIYFWGKLALGKDLADVRGVRV